VIDANTNQSKYIKCRIELVCIGYLELNHLIILLDMNGLLFFLLNILDHLCTTCFVFANPFRKSFQSLFANRKRYMNKICKKRFQDLKFLPMFQMIFLWLNKLPLNEILLLAFKRVFEIDSIFENWLLKIPIEELIVNKIQLRNCHDIDTNVKKYQLKLYFEIFWNYGGAVQLKLYFEIFWNYGGAVLLLWA
jgi:hypothetical protein